MIVIPVVKRLLIGWFNVDSCLRVLNFTGVQAFFRRKVHKSLAILVR